MNIKKEYYNAIENRQLDKAENILLNRMLENADYKSISDYASVLSDCEYDGKCIKLSEGQCQKFGKMLLWLSFLQKPDKINGCALQIACLERDNDFKTIINMEPYTKNLESVEILNNIAYSKYCIGQIADALELQNAVLDMSLKQNDCNDTNKGIICYNMLIYQLFSNNQLEEKYYKKAVKSLISDDFYDYLSAIVLSILFDDVEFINSNIDTLTKFFIVEKKTKRIINNYLNNRLKPDLKEVKEILLPKTIYGNNFYLKLE